MAIFCLLLFVHLIQAAFYGELDNNSVSFSHVISETSEPSVIACIHRCRLIDIKSGTVYEKGVCKCIKTSMDVEANDVTVSGVVLHEKKIKGDANVALRKPSKQSSTYNGPKKYGAELANDGNVKTTSVTGHWWQVDLLRPTTIKRIELVLHKWAFYKGGKYVNVVIEIRSDNNSPWSICKDIGVPQGPFVKTTCDSPLMVGRYVRITASKVLYLDEVKVIAVED